MVEHYKAEIENKAANASFAASAGLLSVGALLEIPDTLTDFSEPIGLTLALIGTLLKLIKFFKR